MPYATHDGTRIHYQVEGGGEPLLLYHGLTGSAARWRDTGYTAGLGNDYQLILIDARGHGQRDDDRRHDHECHVLGGSGLVVNEDGD
jgi:pimeloyl-ACP methyl ester carboxylesterase